MYLSIKDLKNILTFTKMNMENMKMVNNQLIKNKKPHLSFDCVD